MTTPKYKLFSQYLDFYRHKQFISPNEYLNIITHSNNDFYDITPWSPQLTPLHILADVSSKYDMWQQENEIEIVPPEIAKTKKHINDEINSIADLISIVDKYPVTDDVEYNINVKMLNKIAGELRELNAMIGLKTLKKNILDQILYFLQGLSSRDEYKHMVIYGSPGTGKTDIAKILGKMYSNMGILTPPSKDKKSPSFKKATRADLVAGYLGQTSIKTKTLIGESVGGVLFIDEIYSLGDDSFSKECADTMCEMLSDNKDNLIVIIAGYENEVNERFFKLNPGLESRFSWRFTIDDYSSSELWQIFKKKIDGIGWINDVSDSDGEAWFKRKYSDFPGFGRDIDSLLFKVKIAHSRRLYGKEDGLKTISLCDLDLGLALFKESMKKSAIYCEKKFVSSMFL
jgi:SpoVK/Ycf46/Vps4 family AAA+-type ATPase